MMLKSIIRAPKWLRDQRVAQMKLPTPTLEEVRRILEASADWDYKHRYDNIWTIDSQGRKVVR